MDPKVLAIISSEIEIENLEDVKHLKSELTYEDLALIISTPFRKTDIFSLNDILSKLHADKIKGNKSLQTLKDLLICLRDVKENNHNSQSCKYVLSQIMKIKKSLVFMQRIQNEQFKESYWCNFYIYPFIYAIQDVLDVIIFRYFRKFVTEHIDSMNLVYFLYDWRSDINDVLDIGPSTEYFNNALQEKVGSRLDVPYFLMAGDNECVICDVKLKEDSDFAVLDSCNHLMCANCAETTLMGRVSAFHENDQHIDEETGELIDIVPGGYCAALEKVPRCPICRREVGCWTTSHLVQFFQNNGYSNLRFDKLRVKQLSEKNYIIYQKQATELKENSLDVDYGNDPDYWV